MPLSRNDTPQTHHKPSSLEHTIESAQEEVIFVCIVEVERAAGYTLPFERPVVALCDSMSQTSWISSQFLADLGKSASDTYSYTAHAEHGTKGQRNLVNIRWSCDILKLRHQESSFFIEPNAQFKILLGCASRIGRRGSKTYQSSGYSWGHNKSTFQKEPQIRDSAKEAFQQGIQDGVLQPLRQAFIPEEDRSSGVNISDIEMELDYTWRIHASTEQTLSSAADDDTSSCPPPMYAEIPSSVEIISLRDSESDSGCYSTCESTNTSISCRSLSRRALTERTLRERHAAQPHFSLHEWIAEPTINEPWALGARIAPLEQRPVSFKRCENLTRTQQAKLLSARAAARTKSEEYWIWDEERQDYKHYDEGCTDPVWYKSS